MNAFINTFKSVIDDTISKRITFVLGNESCDLDSAVSSLVCAYFFDWIKKQNIEINESKTVEQKTDNFLPIFDISKDDLLLRTEVTFLFKKYNIKFDSLLYKEDLNVVMTNKKHHAQLFLVDHHILSREYSKLLPLVLRIFDHRPKDEIGWVYDDSVKVNMSLVGSCATLICSEISTSGCFYNFFNENQEAAHLLYATILLDTCNFSAAADRARPLDFEMAEKLEEVLNIKTNDAYRKKTFQELLTARTDYSSLNSSQLLRRDLKIVNTFPLPGLPLLVKDYLKRSDCEEALKNFCIMHNSPTIVIIGLVVVDEKVTRDLAVFSMKECDLHRSVVDALCNAKIPSLDLKKSDCSLDNCDYFEQCNIKASRKQIVPIIKSLFK